ncbi:MAG: hypothetical protein M3291_02285 [Actinomycetota bacterium]|nr:hypothetical protein [Actinomycetota bacterium]
MIMFEPDVGSSSPAAPAPASRNGLPGELVVRLRPAKVIAQGHLGRIRDGHPECIPPT